MSKLRLWLFVAILTLAALSNPMLAVEALTLNVLRFSERRDVKFRMFPTRRVGEGQMEAEVKVERGEARIRLKYERMKPAVLFGGDITCYVLWAVTQDGIPVNLGELWFRPSDEKGTVQFSTGLRSFALVITAEPYYKIDQPSDLVMFWNDGQADPPIGFDQVFFEAFEEAPPVEIESLANRAYAGTKPLALMQAERVHQIAVRMGAERHAVALLTQAQAALEQANQMYNQSREKETRQFSRRSAEASSEAIRLTQIRNEFQRIEELADQREREVAELKARLSEAQDRTAQAEETLQRLRAERETARASYEEASSQLESMKLEQASLAQQMAGLERERRELANEREKLQSRLQRALSMVSETRDSARGYIVNLPDILFAVGKATLQTEAKLALAKLAGILLIFQDLNLRIEGHTDATGSAAPNLRLSERRAQSVADLLTQEGISPGRITLAGYGENRPIADNRTAAGRKKNRRVEIIIATGRISALDD